MSLMGSPQWAYNAGTTFKINQSLRVEDIAGSSSGNVTTSQSLMRKFDTAFTSTKIGTISVWVKRTRHPPHTYDEKIFHASSPAGAEGTLHFRGSASQPPGITLYFHNLAGNAKEAEYRTNAAYRDYSAWYHILVAIDTTQNTAANRLKLYVNGSQVTSWETEDQFDQNDDVYFFGKDNSQTHYVGPDSSLYLSEFYYIDGTALTPSTFGETDDTYGHWKPKEPEDLTYGNNGFYLPFKGDYSVEGFSAVTYEGEGGSRYVGGTGFQPDLTWIKRLNGNGSHRITDSLRGQGLTLMADVDEDEYIGHDCTTFHSDGFTNGGNSDDSGDSYVAWNWDMGGGSYGFAAPTINVYGDAQHSTSQQKFGASSIAFDGTADYIDVPHSDFMTSGGKEMSGTGDFTVEMWVYPTSSHGWKAFATKGVSNGWAMQIRTNDANYAMLTETGGNSVYWGFSWSLNNWNHIAAVFSTKGMRLYHNGSLATHTSGTRSYTTMGANANPYQFGRLNVSGETDPDPFLGYMDEIRISNKDRYPVNFTPDTSAFTNDANTLLLIHSDTSNGSTTFVDSSGATKNTTGTIDSYVKANTTYGQSMVHYTGTGSAGTVGHGLGTVPEMIIVKNRSKGAGESWCVYHANNTAAPETDVLLLNSNGATIDTANVWNDTAPTSSVFSVNNDDSTNDASEGFIAYCFDSVSGYSSFGGYTGDGTYNGSKTVTCGFTPAWVMIKCTNDTESWWIFDNVRNEFGGNTDPKRIAADSSAAQVTGGSTGSDWIQFTSTGFKMTGQGGGTNGGSGQTYVYAAFADKREYAYWLDQSGNNNDFTSNNITESNIVLDTPTNNFCTLNPLSHAIAMSVVQIEGNLQTGASGSSGAPKDTHGTIPVTSGKWYFETLVTNASGGNIGIVNIDEAPEYITAAGTVTSPFCDDEGWGFVLGNGNKEHAGSNVSFDSQPGVGSVVMTAFDMDDGKIWWGVNGRWLQSGNPATAANPVYTSQDFGTAVPVLNAADGAIMTVNFGQDSSFCGNKPAQGNQDSGGIGDFYYTPPSGFKAICTSNLPDPADGLWDDGNNVNFAAVTYDGDDTQRTITTGVQSDLIIVKQHNTTNNNWYVVDAVRGIADAAGTSLVLDQDGAGGNASTQVDAIGGATSWQSGQSADYTNGGSRNYVNYTWKANGTGSSQTAANLDGTVSCNPTAGFVISKYTGNGSAGQSFALGEGTWSGSAFPTSLNKAPEMMWIKNISDDDHWVVFYNSGGSMNQTDKLRLNTDMALVDDNDAWADMATTRFWAYVDTDNQNNGSSNEHIAYCWHSVEGYSKIGHYKGNGNADGSFVYTGFTPKMIIIKSLAQESWWCIDTEQDSINPIERGMRLDLSAGTYTSDKPVDVLSNGFKTRAVSGFFNDSGQEYIYMTFAETPFKYTTAR